MEQLELYVPKLEDLWFYQKMMSDPETMSYNANWDVNYDGYHRDTGCVDYPDAVLPAWYENMVGAGTVLCLHKAQRRRRVDRRRQFSL